MSGSAERLRKLGQRARRGRDQIDAMIARVCVGAFVGVGTCAAETRTGRHPPGLQVDVSGAASVWVRPKVRTGIEKRKTEFTRLEYERTQVADRKRSPGNRTEIRSHSTVRAPCINDAHCVDFWPCTTDFCFEGTCVHDITPMGTECRTSAGLCDPAELCDGVTVGCPADGREPAGTECRADIGLCDLTEVCDGVLASCPVDVIQAAGTECRTSVGACDLTETCDGISGACPADSMAVAGTVCRPAIGLCDSTESCDGVSGTCPTDVLVPGGTACRASAGLCDLAEFCTGVSGACPPDTLEPPTTECRGSTGSCDPAEACDGISGSCPSDTLEPNGTACDDGQACVVGETCQTGICTGGGAPDCAASSVTCNTATCDPSGSEGNCDVLSPVVDGMACDDGTPCTDAVCTSGVCMLDANTAVATVNLSVEGLSNAVARDVTFVVTTCAGAGDLRIVSVSFDNAGSGAALLTGVDGAASWMAVTEGHSLRRLLPLTFTNCAAQVDFNGGESLIAGDFQTADVAQDNIVDITDFSVLASRFNVPIDPTSSSGADATGDGIQASADFGAIQANFFLLGDPLDACSPETNRDDGSFALRALEHTVAVPVLTPRESLPASTLPSHHRARVDLNDDGVVDVRDMREFAARHGLPFHPETRRGLRRSAIKRPYRRVRR